jgi:hypothetical protein
MDRFAPCTTSGVTASNEQVCRVLALHARPSVIALDGEEAGVAGTGRWLSGLCLDCARLALVTTLPTGATQRNGLPSKVTRACRPSTVEGRCARAKTASNRRCPDGSSYGSSPIDTRDQFEPS